MWWQVHSFSGALAVALGAFGAHGLKSRVADPKLLEVWDTAVKYHMVHSLIGLLATLPTHPAFESLVKQPVSHMPIAKWANYFAFAGNVLFSGSLYGIVLTGVRKLGIITPFGGLCYIAAWGCLAKGR